MRAVVFAAAVLLGQPAPATVSGAELDHYRFDVMRNDSTVGSHDVRIETDGPRTIVNTHTDIRVSLLSLELYRFVQVRTEIRENGRLVHYESWTDNNGEILEVTADATDGGLKVRGMNGVVLADSDLLPTTYWDHATVRQDRLIEGSYGRVISVTVSEAATETMATDGREIRVTRYKVRGDLTRDLWYDDVGVWRGMEFKARDGSVIAYKLRSQP